MGASIASFGGGTSGNDAVLRVSIATTVGGTVIKAVSGTRIAITLKNTGSEVVDLRGGGDPVAGSHFPLDPGESITLTTRLAIKGIVPATTGEIAYWEENTVR